MPHHPGPAGIIFFFFAKDKMTRDIKKGNLGVKCVHF